VTISRNVNGVLVETSEALVGLRILELGPSTLTLAAELRSVREEIERARLTDPALERSSRSLAKGGFPEVAPP